MTQEVFPTKKPEPDFLKSQTTRTKIIYLAGPLRHPSVTLVSKTHIERAKFWAEVLWNLGAVVISPHLNSGELFGRIPESHVMNGYLELIDRVDGLVILPEWQDSEGTRAEISRARSRNIPFFFLPDPMIERSNNDVYHLVRWISGE